MNIEYKKKVEEALKDSSSLVDDFEKVLAGNSQPQKDNFYLDHVAKFKMTLELTDKIESGTLFEAPSTPEDEAEISVLSIFANTVATRLRTALAAFKESTIPKSFEMDIPVISEETIQEATENNDSTKEMVNALSKPYQAAAPGTKLINFMVVYGEHDKFFLSADTEDEIIQQFSNISNTTAFAGKPCQIYKLDLIPYRIETSYKLTKE